MPRIRRQTLTKIMVEGAKPKSQPYRLWDAKVPGLCLRVLPSGRSTYELHWARNKSTSLGTNGVMTLEAARVAARNGLGEVAKHGAPVGLQVAPGVGGGSTLGEYLLSRYGPHIEAVNKAGASDVAALKAQFGHLMSLPIASITKSHFDDFKAKRLKQGTHPATVNRDLDRLKAALSKAEAWGLLEHNPLRGVKRITRGIENRVRYLSREEEIALRGALDAREAEARIRRQSGDEWRAARGLELKGALPAYSDHLKPMTLLALNTGMRRGELTQLTWADIDLQGKRVTIRAGYAKSGTARHLPLNAEATAVMKTYRKQHALKGPLFAVTSVSTSWRSLMAAAKIADFRFHDLRHTFASHLVMGGVDLNTVRELMGHSDLKMTLRYAHLAPEHKAAAVETLVTMRVAPGSSRKTSAPD